MQKFVDERGNTIYAHRPPSELNVYIETKGSKGATIYLAREVKFRGLCVIALMGENATLFVGNAKLGNTFIELYQDAVCYIGDDSTMHGSACPQRLRTAVGTTLMIGNDCMISENIEITVSDGHCIYEADSGKNVSLPRSVFIGDHVWLGRNSSVLKGSRMASGSILGLGAILTGKSCAPNTIHAGVPAKMLATGKLWGRETLGEEKLTEQEKCKRMFECDADAVIRPCDIEHTLNSLATSHEKIAFLYDAIYCNSAHNRFAWSKETADARDGRLIPYNNSFEQHVAHRATVKLNDNDEPLRSYCAYPGDDSMGMLQLHALWLKRYAIWWQYLRCSFMRSICSGNKKRHYKEKKAYYRHLLRRITTYKKMMNASLRLGNKR